MRGDVGRRALHRRPLVGGPAPAQGHARAVEVGARGIERTGAVFDPHGSLPLASLRDGSDDVGGLYTASPHGGPNGAGFVDF